MISHRHAVFLAVGLAAACALLLNTRRFQRVYLFMIQEHEASSVQPMDALFPVVDTAEDKALDWMTHNSRSLRALLECLAGRSCGPRQDQVVILASVYFLGARRGSVSGEHIWANSMMTALAELGYTVLYSNNFGHAAFVYALVPSLVRAVVLDEWDMDTCATDAICAKSPRHPLGIPVWKLFSFTFFRGVNYPIPLDQRWFLAPEDYEGTGHVYTGYSIERTCAGRPVLQPDQREPLAFVLGKHKGYWQESFFAWSGVDWTRPPDGLEAELGLALPRDFRFVACADSIYTADPKLPLPPGVHNICEGGRNLPQTGFVEQLSKARLLVGVGRPWISPTPYEALCLGVPFLNPIHNWDVRAEENRTKWSAQHDGLREEDAPRVYNVFKHKDEKLREREFWTAVLRAVNTPVDRYVLGRMTMASVKDRVDKWLQHDWRADAELLQEDRKTKGEKVFTL